MLNTTRLLMSAAALSVLTLAAPAGATPNGVKVGILTCHVDSGWGYVLGSSKDMQCEYRPNAGEPDHYVGTMSKFGVDIGYTRGAEIVWDVIAPTSDVRAGALQGDYAGATASATVLAGVGAHVLLGGFDKSLALQPVSVEGNSGLDIAAGVGEMSLRAVAPPPPPRPVAELPPPPPRELRFAVFFDFNKSNLTPGARAAVVNAVNAAEQNGLLKIRINGHADTVGSNSYNDELSYRRALAVRNEMLRDGLSGASISVDGKGFHDPRVPTGPGVREPENRGVTIELRNVSVSELSYR